MSHTTDRVALAEKIVRGVWSTYTKPMPIPSYHKTPTTPQPENNANSLFVGAKENNAFGLNLISQYYHAPSSLHNEGVWHNCLMGMNYIQLAQRNENRSAEYKRTCEQLATSLYKLNFDDQTSLFRNRTHSEYWNHET